MGSRDGIFISLEGGEGSGKTTQLRRLVEHLRSRGRTVLETREPGGTEVGELLRDILLHRAAALTPRAELALYLASRAQLVDDVIRPALAAGTDVVCDRFMDSSVAYQGGGRELGVDLATRLNDWAIAGVRPDLTLYFDVAPETGLARRSARSGGSEDLDRIEREPLGFHDRVREAFRVIARGEPNRVRWIETEDGEERVWNRVRTAVDEFLGAKGKDA